ncbi:MAG TPA: hypothetical protein VNQ79_18225 [Blastocatellia bacterium]|nr:hypothetical protein [Blastocatellia bacterium]
MRTSHKLTSLLLSLAALFAFASAAMAADPGTPFPADSAISDQKAGSVLIYNIYTSSLNNPGAENTRINITNTNDTGRDVFVHFFFVDGTNCSVADSYVCLTPNQTMTFNMSDTDPGVMGYVIAVATDGRGCPIAWNYLIGDEYVKFQSGHAANLGAEAVAAIDATGPNGVPDGVPDGLVCDAAAASNTTLRFDGRMYNALPRVLALDHIMSRGDGNDTLLIVNRIGGSLVTTAAGIGSLFGLLFDPLENPASWTSSAGCQLKRSLGPGNFPRTTPRFEQFIPTGSYGWMKFWSTGGTDGNPEPGLLGAAINFNPNAGSNQNAFNGGHNLHKLTFTTTNTLVIPVFTAFCS